MSEVRRWLRSHAGIVVLVAIPLVLFGGPLIIGRLFLNGDNLVQNFPLRILVGQDIIHGHLPLDNPYIYSGAPLLGGFNAGAVYPLTWMFAVLPTSLAWTLDLIAAYEVALVGTYLFLRRQPMSGTAATFGAAAFSFAGYFSGQIVHIDLISGAGWLPWMLLAIHNLTEYYETGASSNEVRGTAQVTRRRAFGWTVLLAIFAAMTILAGAPEAILDGAVVVLMYTIWRIWKTGLLHAASLRRLGAFVCRVAIAVIGGLVLSAAQWIPGQVFTDQSQRAVPTYTYFSSGSLPWRLTVLLFSPFAMGTNQSNPIGYFGTYNLPEVASYVGVLALIAAFALLCSRWRRRPESGSWWIWYIVLGVSLVAAWGGDTPFGHVLFSIPEIRSQRLLNRNLLGVDFSLATLLAWWVHMMLTDRARRETESAQPKDLTDRAARERGGHRARWSEVMLTCVPVAIIAVLCIGTWLWGSGLEAAIRVSASITTTARYELAGIMTGGLVIAIAATWIVLARSRFTARQLRCALTGIMTADLLLFTAFMLQGPVTSTTAYATSSQATQFAALVGNGRFIIYDPDTRNFNQLITVGRNDLNVLRRVLSAQGYASLVSNEYFQATGTHAQQTLDPKTLLGPTWDDLDVHVLLSLPSYFVTPVTPSQVGTTSNTRTRLTSGTTHTWYFGGMLSLSHGDIPVTGVSAGAAVQMGVVTASGSVRWLPQAVLQRNASHQGTSVRFSLPTPTPAAGVVLRTAPGTTLTALVPEVHTAQDGDVLLNGPLANTVTPPHWQYTGTLESFGVFRNTQRGQLWTVPRGSDGTSSDGSGSTDVRVVSSGIDGTERITVRTDRPIWLVRSEAAAPGWKATIQPIGSSSSSATPVVTSGVIQKVAVPAGDYEITFRYEPTNALVGIALSAVGGVTLIGIGIVSFFSWRRRRSSSRQPV